MSTTYQKFAFIQKDEYLELDDRIYYDILEKWLKLKEFPMLVKHTRMFHPDKRRHVYVQVFITLKEFEKHRAGLFFEQVCEGNAYMKDWVSTINNNGEITPVIYAHDSNFTPMEISHRNRRGFFSSKDLGSREAYYEMLIDFGLITLEELRKIKSISETEKAQIKTVTML